MPALVLTAEQLEETLDPWMMSNLSPSCRSPHCLEISLQKEYNSPPIGKLDRLSIGRMCVERCEEQEHGLTVTRRQSLPHTDTILPTTGDVWKIVKHMVHTFMLLLADHMHRAHHVRAMGNQDLRLFHLLLSNRRYVYLLVKSVLICEYAQVIARTLDVPVPPTMSLPITELQRRAEELEFSELLDQVYSFFPHIQSPQLES